MIRVGRITFKNGKQILPTFDNFTSILVTSHSNDYSDFSPFSLLDEKGRIFENVWQFSKVYKTVPLVNQTRDLITIWSWPREIHVFKNKIEPTYWEWRNKGMNNSYPVRFPVGKQYMNTCLFSIKEDNPQEGLEERLDYIRARKEIYLPNYTKLVRNLEKFNELKQRLNNGENLLLIDYDGPHQESLYYYQIRYTLPYPPSDFILNDTILVNKENMRIMLNDDRHPFGHGYCLAMALLDVNI